MYSGLSNGVVKKKSLRYHGMNSALFFALGMVLFKSNLVSMREADGDPGSCR